eukprot:gnl/Spiro4/2721_TR1317_c0_g1_i1.p1 gnl/Spiro4/2721_TR1317_c0_g1~~gnl/Spiro4/2721_TR1317_c0_g1_i1.p1  ORF type:complete len:488 (-),score=116.20 gnl/Spiro4/2721_TR1317_c0_g1_i1:171-1634(-)
MISVKAGSQLFHVPLTNGEVALASLRQLFPNAVGLYDSEAGAAVPLTVDGSRTDIQGTQHYRMQSWRCSEKPGLPYILLQAPSPITTPRASPTVQDSCATIRFPSIRTVLWDRTPLGPEVLLGPESVLPLVALAPQCVATLVSHLHNTHARPAYRTARPHPPARGGDAIAKGGKAELAPGLMLGSFVPVLPGGAPGGPAFKILVDTFDANPEVMVDPLPLDGAVPLLLSYGVSQQHGTPANENGWTVEEYLQFFSHTRSRIARDGAVDIARYMPLRVRTVLFESTDTLDVTGELILPSLHLSLMPVCELRVAMTPLAVQLRQSPPDPHEPFASGYVTLDQSRAAVLLLDTDPSARSVPLVGIWVSNAEGGVRDGMVWAALMRFVHNEALTDRVLMDNEAFLVLLFNCGDRAFECIECTLQVGDAQHKIASFQFRRLIDVSALRTLAEPPFDLVGDPFRFQRVCDPSRGAHFFRALDSLKALGSLRQK